jgi:hypothetical protein
MWWVGRRVKPTPTLRSQAQRSQCSMVMQQPRHTHTRPTRQDARRGEKARRQSGLVRQWWTRPPAWANSAHSDPCSGPRTPTNTRTHPQRQTPRRTHTHNPWARPHTRTHPPPGLAETHQPNQHPACTHIGPLPSSQTLNRNPQPRGRPWPEPQTHALNPNPNPQPPAQRQAAAVLATAQAGGHAGQRRPAGPPERQTQAHPLGTTWP